MRIGMFTDAYTPDINGVVSSIVTLKTELERQGHEVFVVTTKSSASKEEEPDDHIIRLAGIELKSLYGYVLTSPIHFAALEEIKKMNLDVIHVHTEFGVGIFARIVSNKLSIPLVSTYHTMYEDYTHYVNIFNLKSVEKVVKQATYSLSKLYGDKCTALIVPSEKTKERLEFYGIKKKIHVIPTGLDLERFDPIHTSEEMKQSLRKEIGVSDDDFLIVYVGRVAEEKSIDLVIDGFSFIKKAQKKIRLAVIGGGPQLDDLKKQAQKLGLEDYVFFTDRRPHDMIPGYYHCADAFVSASLSETQGMTFIEALASGLVVFARPDDVLTDLVIENETGYLFHTPEEFANQLMAYASLDEGSREQMKKQAKEKAAIYDSRLFGQKVYEVYQEAIQIYEKTYTIEKIKSKDDMVEMTVSSKDEQIKIVMTMDVYAEKKYHLNEMIHQEELEMLQNQEQFAQTYAKCIRKIAAKDRTRKEMYDFLTQDPDLSIKLINDVIDKLEQKGYINDYRYMMMQIESMKLLRYGNNRIVRTLVKKGISQPEIEEVLRKEDGELETIRGLKWAERQQMKPSDKPLKMQKMDMKRKLYQQGYETDVVNEIMNRLDFVEDHEKEKQNLKKMADRAWKRYAQKYEGTKLRNVVFRYLVAKGFDYDDIYEVIGEIERAND
ncbi:MAG: RecX family transcriptional regulator [Erysipelotrichaceae bacterium]|nr:RecX family transcriptional regulator [Erysipelotrichaceae bacterium]